MHLAIGIFIIAGLFIGGYQLLKLKEADQFNNGVCKCGGHFKAFPKEVQECLPGAARGYQCDACRTTIWLTYATDVDYEYTESGILNNRKEKDQ